MRVIGYDTVKNAIHELFASANRVLPCDAQELIKNAAVKESDPLARSVMNTICRNLDAARENSLPICQDTGMAVVFAEVGCEVFVDGNLTEAINEGVREAYIDERFRCSVVAEPLFNRVNTGDNTPAIIHISITEGDKLRLIAAPKGFGSENMSALRMFTPSATKDDVVDFVLDSVKKAGSNPCPPIMIGLGVGGDFEECALLAKKALCRDVSKRNPHPDYAALEREILEKVNALGIGPQGFGGDTTCLAVNAEYGPTHIAGLPVAININCHVMRHKEITI